MKLNNIKWLTGGMITVALASVVTSCQDEHFDINSDVLGKQTLWQNIQSKPELSDYAEILEKVYNSKSEDKATPETYAEMFNSEQTFTVWAPKNGSFNKQYYLGLLNTGVRDSIYKVEKELIRNNMARYSYVINGKDSVKLELFNEKSGWLNYNKGTFKGVKMTNTNIGASNGVLHIIEAPSSYLPNMYEFLATRPELDSINTFIKHFQESLFDENKSTKGPIVKGEVTYVDSIFNIYNSYTAGKQDAYLNAEDSNYVMIIPTNEVWKKEIENTKKYFNFKSHYEQEVHFETESGLDSSATVTTDFKPLELDSLKNYYTKSALCKDLVFNANWQYEEIPITSIKDIQAADARQDSLLATSGIKYKKTGTLNITNHDSKTLEVDNFANMFGNADPVEVSNGYAYVVNSFNYPSTTYAPIIDRSGFSSKEYEDTQCLPITGQDRINFNITSIETTEGDIVEVDTTLTYDYVAITNKNSTSNPGAFFKVPDVLSCKYDIYVVIVYNYNYKLPNKFRAYISYDKESGWVKNEVLKNPNEGALDAKGGDLYGTNYFVTNYPAASYDKATGKMDIQLTDTVCIAKDFSFPICYKDLKNAYPVIQIKCNMTTSEKAYYCREILLNSIVLKPKGHNDDN